LLFDLHKFVSALIQGDKDYIDHLPATRELAESMCDGELSNELKKLNIFGIRVDAHFRGIANPFVNFEYTQPNGVVQIASLRDSAMMRRYVWTYREEKAFS
jgi:hypothetical protein